MLFANTRRRVWVLMAEIVLEVCAWGRDGRDVDKLPRFQKLQMRTKAAVTHRRDDAGSGGGENP